MASSARDAGASALELAAQLTLTIDCVSREVLRMVTSLEELRRRRDRFLAGAAGERHVIQALLDALCDGWTLLADRSWPGCPTANLDLLLVGPGGVLVVDVKRWSGARVTDGRLWRGDRPADDAVQAVTRQARAVQEVLLEAGLAPGEVVPVLVLDHADVPLTAMGPVKVLGERYLAHYLVHRAERLDSGQVAHVHEALERACPPRAGHRPSRAAAAREALARPDGQLALLDPEDVWRALVDAAAAERIEAWMTWLHPTQGRLVTRTWNGPARIRGPAGTGKTVVALHRTRHLATQGRRVLFTSYVHTLAPVFRSLFARLAPDLVDRVRFASVHQVAGQLLKDAGRTCTVEQQAIDTCFAQAWATVRRHSVLDGLGVPPGYWQDEISRVIKGRGVTDAAQYAALRRHGRRTALAPVHRAAVWQLYQEYERRRVERGLLDWEDVLHRADEAVASGRAQGAWDAVVVDEVQDLTGTALRLLHRLVGDRPDGLLLVGDSQQSLYSGGVSLAESGISVVGRAAVLNVNYRNAEAVHQAALALVGADTVEDLDAATSTDGERTVQVVRGGGTVVRAEAADAASQRHALLHHLAELASQGVRYGDVALLVPTNRAAGHWLQALRAAEVPAMLLAHYTGIREDAVKVGTFQRAKALDFAHVLIPDTDSIPAPRRPTESEDAYAERAAQERRRLYVGYTRARDGLWLGTCAPRRSAPQGSAVDDGGSGGG